MKPGTYKAKAINAGLGESKAGNPQPWIEFETGEGNIKWFGNLVNEKSQDITVNNLLAAGFRGKEIDEIGDLAKWDQPEVEVVITEEEYQGKKKTRVKFINSPSQMKEFKGQAPKMAGLFAVKKKEMGIKDKDEWDV